MVFNKASVVRKFLGSDMFEPAADLLYIFTIRFLSAFGLDNVSVPAFISKI